MKVICINDIEIMKHDNPYIEPKEYKWQVLKVGESYTVSSIYNRSNGGKTYFIKEVMQFIPTELFVSLQQLRDQKLNELGI
jgi:hypothetical protein